MEFAGLVQNQVTSTVMGVTCVYRKHTVAFRQYAQLLAVEGRVMEFTDEGKPRRIVDAGSLDLYRKIVRATILDGLVRWDLKTSEGEAVEPSDAVLADLDARYGEFVTALFDEIEAFNLALPASKKKSFGFSLGNSKRKVSFFGRRTAR